jgi:hypothetical protein
MHFSLPSEPTHVWKIRIVTEVARCSFHLDHAAALTYITEKVLIRFYASNIEAKDSLDEFQRWKRKGVYDASNKGSTQVHDAGLCSDGVRVKHFSSIR